MTLDDDSTAFSRLHKLFVFHLGVAVGLAWMTAVYAAMVAPWVRNIRALIDPTTGGRVESTWSFLFGLPLVLTVAWLMLFFAGDMLRRFRMLKSQAAEFGIAGPIAFVMFYMAIDRAVAAIHLAG